MEDKEKVKKNSREIVSLDSDSEELDSSEEIEDEGERKSEVIGEIDGELRKESNIQNG